MAGKKKNSDSPTIENRRARHDYLITDTLEVGICLQGTEVKAVRAGQVSLQEGYVRVREDPPGLELHGISIAEYAPGGLRQHAPGRMRHLLAHRREILKLFRQVQQKGMTVVPLRMYFKNGYAKVLIGLGTGRGKSDKRRAIADRESQRELQRAMSKRV